MRVWVAAQRGIAIPLLLLASPFLVLIGLFVRVDSSGPILYRAKRVGIGGSLITVHKFRTMQWIPVAGGPSVTYVADPRVTRVGRVLRRSRLDELPQLWDVARGVMALVGPRPEAPDFVDLHDARWLEVLSVRPGITGRSQLIFLDEAARIAGDDPAERYRTEVLPAKLDSDIAYVRNRTVGGDIRILAATLRLAIRRHA